MNFSRSPIHPIDAILKKKKKKKKEAHIIIIILGYMFLKTLGYTGDYIQNVQLHT